MFNCKCKIHILPSASHVLFISVGIFTVTCVRWPGSFGPLHHAGNQKRTCQQPRLGTKLLDCYFRREIHAFNQRVYRNIPIRSLAPKWPDQSNFMQRRECCCPPALHTDRQRAIRTQLLRMLWSWIFALAMYLDEHLRQGKATWIDSERCTNTRCSLDLSLLPTRQHYFFCLITQSRLHRFSSIRSGTMKTFFVALTALPAALAAPAAR